MVFDMDMLTAGEEDGVAWSTSSKQNHLNQENDSAPQNLD